MGFLRVIEPGVLSTVQDLGRPGLSHMGIPIGGAADRSALMAANVMVGNPPGAAAIELTVTGASFEVENSATVAIMGAAIIGHIQCPTGEVRNIDRACFFALEKGDQLIIKSLLNDARAYFAVAGGLQVPAVLGSASTNLGAGWGGLDGRRLQRGDRIEFGPPNPALVPDPSNVIRSGPSWYAKPPKLHIPATFGPHAASIGAECTAAFFSSSFRVSSRSDRVGVRLEACDGSPALHPESPAGRMTTEPMTWGAVQLPPDGQPIILLCDHPTTGGYPIIACVPTVALPLLGRLRPADTVRFTPISPSDAIKLYQDWYSQFARAAGL